MGILGRRKTVVDVSHTCARLASKHRRRQTKLQGAVAEAELDVCTTITTNTLERDLAEAAEDKKMFYIKITN